MLPVLLITAAAVFLTVFLFILSISGSRNQPKLQVTEQLEKFLGDQQQQTDSTSRGKKEKIHHSILQLIGKMLASRNMKIKVEQELARADILLKGEEFLGLVLLLAIGLGAIILLAADNFLLGFATAILGAYLPFFIVRSKQSKRQRKFNGQIADALVLMANALRSGFSFLQSMDMVRQEMPDPIAKEFGIALLEMNWGNSTETALLDLAERVKSNDFDLVITAVLIQRQVGGNLAEILSSIAHTIKERVRIKGEIKTLTAQGRISGLIIGLLPIVLSAIIYLLNPGYLNLLFTTEIGLIMLLSAVVAQMLGVLIIRKIISIEV